MADIAALTRMIEPEVQAEGLALVRVMMIGGKDDPTLQVMAERPDTRQLDIADCERLHRRIVDRHEELTEDYRIEVSSPGIDRPLTRLADYDDWKGHEARLTLNAPLNGRKQFAGALIGTEGETVMIDARGIGPVGLPFADIEGAKLLLTDRLIQATQPLSAEGADQIEELTEEQD